MLGQSAIILHNRNNMVLQNFITVPISHQCTPVMHQFTPPGVRYHSPHHHTTATKYVGFFDAVLSKTFISPPVHPDSTICTLYQESGFITEPNSPSLLGPYSLFLYPLESVLTVLLVQNNISYSDPSIS
jgi:hypothetical protein